MPSNVSLIVTKHRVLYVALSLFRRRWMNQSERPQVQADKDDPKPVFNSLPLLSLLALHQTAYNVFIVTGKICRPETCITCCVPRWKKHFLYADIFYIILPLNTIQTFTDFTAIRSVHVWIYWIIKQRFVFRIHK